MAPSGRNAAAMNPPSARYAPRQPKPGDQDLGQGAENARANPFADCTTATAMPRLRTKRRDRIGTNTTNPRQFAPSVITTP